MEMPPRVTLSITQDTATGAVSVTGPIEQKSICYALLEVARDIIKDHTDKIAASPIVRPTGVLDFPQRPQ